MQCSNCSKTAAPNRKLCVSCRDIRRAAYKRFYIAERKRGNCDDCGLKAKPGRNRCGKCTKKSAISGKTQRINIKNEVFKAYGGKICKCCNENQEEFLVIDHVNGGGKKQLANLKLSTGDKFYRWLRRNKYPDGYQVLCHNCNIGKARCGICPHQR